MTVYTPVHGREVPVAVSHMNIDAAHVMSSMAVHDMSISRHDIQTT